MVFQSNIVAPDDIVVHSIDVFRNLITDSLIAYDSLYLVYYDLQYAVYPTDYTIDKAFIFQLIDVDGTTILASQIAYPFVHLGYGKGVVGFYLASGVASWGDAVSIRITENPAVFAPPLDAADFTVDAADYTALTTQASNRAALATEVLRIAEELEQEWLVTLTSAQDQGTVLSSNGELYFRAAIAQLQVMAPSIFFLQSVDIDTSTRTWGTTLGDTYKARLVGTWIEDSFQGVADLINIPYLLVIGLLCLGFSVYVIKVSYTRFGTAMPGYMASMVVVIGGTILALGFTALGLITLGLLLVGGWFLFMRRA